MPKRTQLQKTAIAILLVFCLLMGMLPAAGASSLNDVQVLSAPLTTRAAVANGMVRVYLSSLGSPSTLDLTVVGNYSVSATGEFLSNGDTLTVGFNSSTGELTLARNGQKTNLGKGFSLRRHSAGGTNGIKIRQSRESNNPYPGDLQFKAVSNGWGYSLYVIAHIYIENYLYGVLPYEMGNSTHLEALKAQAVAARTYTVRMMKSRASGLYDVKDTTSDQVYRGTPGGNANCVAAVDATKGIVLMYGGDYITTYYSASNGGQTETVRTGGQYPYLTVKEDPFDYANPSSTVRKKTVYADLSSSLSSASLMNLLKQKAISKLQQAGYGATAANTTLQTLRSVTPHTPKYASPSRLYTKLDFTLTAQTVSASGAAVSDTVTVTCDIFGELESLLGMSIQSMDNELWSVTRNGGNFVLEARRYGHGMGMSQRGAMYMARLGYRYDQILGFYYEGCKRVQHSFSNTILSPDSTDEQVTVEPPAEIENEDNGACTATVSLVSSTATLAIRSRRDTTSAMVGTVGSGALVNVIHNDGSWCYIRIGDLYGYVPANALRISGTPTGEAGAASSISGFATVTANDFVNLRSQGSMSGAVVGTAPAGAVLTVFSQSGGWAKVQYNATVGYANMGFLSAVSAGYPQQTVSSGSARATVVTEDGAGLVNLRESASTGAKVLAQLAPGTQVVVTSDDGSWCAVTWNGMAGYIVASYLQYGANDGADEFPPDEPTDENRPSQPDEPNSSAPEAIATAVVTTANGSLNLRAEAMAGSRILTTIPRGASVAVTELGEVWCGVYYGGYQGYAMRVYLIIDGENQPDESPGDTTAQVATQSGSLNLRAQPRSGSEILARIPQYATLTVHQRGAEWCHVTWNGVTGYVMTVFLSFDGQELPQEPDSPAESDEDEADGETDSTLPITPVPDAQDGLYAVVTTVSGSLNLRRDALPGSQVLARIPKGTSIRVLERLSAWSRTTYAGQTGYVMNDYLTFHEAEEQPAAGDSAVVTTSSGSLNLRLEPSRDAAVIAYIPQYATVAVQQRGDTWCAVSYGQQFGYVMTQFLSFGSAVRPPENSTEGMPNEGETGESMPEGSGDTEEATAAYVSTASGSLNLRERADAYAAILTTIPRQARVTVTRRGADWCAVVYNGTTGYVMTQFLRFAEDGAVDENTGAQEDEILAAPETEAPPAVEQTADAWVYTSSGSLNLREAPNGQVIGAVPRLARVELYEHGAEWSRIRYGSLNGYVMSRYLTLEEPAVQPPTQTDGADSGTLHTPTSGSSTQHTPTASAMSDPTLEAPEGALYADVQPTGGREEAALYAECSQTSAKKESMPCGAMVEIVLKGETWCLVSYLDIQGYCLTSELSMIAP